LNEIKRSKEVMSKLKRWFITPSFILFATSLIILLYARTATGESVISLITLFSISLWTATVSVLVAAGALFAGASIINWSGAAEKDFKNICTELIETKSYKDILTSKLQEINNKDGEIRVFKKQEDKKGISKETIISLLFVSLLFFWSCDAKSVAHSATTKQQKAEVELFVDATHSLDQKQLEDSINHFYNPVLPNSICKNNVSKVSIYHFTDDKNVPKKIFEKDLSNSNKPTSEIEKLLPNINKELNKQKEEEVRQRTKDIEQHTTPTTNGPEPKCTDLNGVFYTISEVKYYNNPHIVTIITDGAENCKKDKSITQIKQQPENLSCLVILVSEKNSSVSRLEDRKAKISQAIPWCKVISVRQFKQYDDLSKAIQ
jgi:hypothetical protein